MFSLLYGLWKYAFSRDDYFILILGLDNSGKTTLLEGIKMKYQSKYKGLKRITSTVGLNVGVVDMPLFSSGVRLVIWDVGGQRELRTLWTKYFSECHALMFVVDSTDETRIQESIESFNQVIQNDMLNGVPLLLVVNKQDHDKSIDLLRIKKLFSQSVGREWHAVAASGLTGQGVEEAMTWILESVKNNSHNRPPKIPDG